MKTVNLKLYTFEELNKDVKKIVIENKREIIGNDNADFWFDDYIDEKQRQLEKQGFVEAELHYSISCSQSDRVDVYCAIDLKKLKEAGIYDYTAAIKKHTVHIKAFEKLIPEMTDFYATDYELEDIKQCRIFDMLDKIAFDISNDLEKIISGMEEEIRGELEDIFCDAYSDETINYILTEGDDLYFADGTEFNSFMATA